MTTVAKGAAAPIVLFAYKRPEHLRRTLEALLANPLAKSTDLIVYSDAARDISAQEPVAVVRRLLHDIKGFRSISIRERATNMGLAKSLIAGISEVLSTSEKAIILEDDLVVTEWFLDFMNDALIMYADEQQVASIHGYSYPTSRDLPSTFFLRGADCWGWATWSRAWKHFNGDSRHLLGELHRQRLTRLFDFDGSYPFTGMLKAQADGSVDSWAIRWYASTFLANMLTLYPGKSLVQNIGHDGSGQHCDETSAFAANLARGPIDLSPIQLSECALGRECFTEFFRSQQPGVWTKVLRRARRRLAR